MKMTAYLGEIHFPNGTYTLVGDEITSEDHVLVQIIIDDVSHEIPAFRTLHTARTKTSMLSSLQKQKTEWKIQAVEVEFEAYCDWCDRYGHFEEDCEYNKPNA